MMAHRQLLKPGPLAVLGAVALFAAHAFALNYAWSRLALPSAVIGGAALLAIAKHLGLLGSVYRILRRRRRPTSR